MSVTLHFEGEGRLGPTSTDLHGMCQSTLQPEVGLRARNPAWMASRGGSTGNRVYPGAHLVGVHSGAVTVDREFLPGVTLFLIFREPQLL